MSFKPPVFRLFAVISNKLKESSTGSTRPYSSTSVKISNQKFKLSSNFNIWPLLQNYGRLLILFMHIVYFCVFISCMYLFMEPWFLSFVFLWHHTNISRLLSSILSPSTNSIFLFEDKLICQCVLYVAIPVDQVDKIR